MGNFKLIKRSSSPLWIREIAVKVKVKEKLIRRSSLPLWIREIAVSSCY